VGQRNTYGYYAENSHMNQIKIMCILCIMALYTIGNQFIETTSYGKANLEKLDAYRLANNMPEFLTTQYRVTPTTIAQVYGTLADATQRETMSTYQHTGYRAIPTSPADIPEMITDSIAMLVIERFGRAIQIADGVHTRYKQAVIDTPMPLSGNTVQDRIYKAAYLHGVVKSIYNTYYAAADEDVSMYELVRPTKSDCAACPVGTDSSDNSASSDSSATDEPNFSQLSVLFTTRMGSLHHNRVETLDAMLMQPMVERNNKSVAQYGAEYLTEMLQTSLPFSFQTTNTARADYVSPNTLSCGFFVMRDPDNPVQVLNIRAFATQVFNFQLDETIYPLAISSGFDLTDLIDMEKFREGNTSTNLVTLLNNICLTLNGDAVGGFTTTDTLWEFGPIADFDTLRCKSAPNIPHWTGKLIKDCIVYKGTIDVPARVRRQMEYMHATYTEFYNGQLILFPYTDNSTDSTNEKIVTIIYVIKNGVGEMGMQTKEARIDTIFPPEPLGTNTAIARELLVENTKGGPILFVDPNAETMTVRGKLGVGIEAPTTTVDIDDTSVGDMTRFINKIAEKTKDVNAMCTGVQSLILDNDMVWYNANNHTINSFHTVGESELATYYLGSYTVVASNGYDLVHFVVFSSQSADVKDTTNAVNMPEFTFTEAAWNALSNTTAGHVLLESMTVPTHADIRNKAITIGDPAFIYELDMTSKNAKDTMVVHSAAYSTWTGHTLQYITDNADSIQEDEIQQSILPPIQSILSDSLCYAGSVKSFVVAATTQQPESKYVITGSILFGKAFTPRRQTIHGKMRNQIVTLQQIAKTAEIDSITYLMTVHSVAEAPQGGAWNGGDAADLAAMGDVGVQRSGGSIIPDTDQNIWRHAFTYTLERLLQIVIDMDLPAIDFWTHLQTINLPTERDRLEEDMAHISGVGYALDIQDNITAVQENSVLWTLIGLHTLFDKMYVTPSLYLIGRETNLRDNPINIRNTTYVQEWFRRIHAMDIRMNFVKYHHMKNVNTFGYGITHAEASIGTLLTKYPGLAANIYLYTIADNQSTLSIDSIATKAVVGSEHAAQPSGTPTVIDDITDPVLRDMHTLFVTQYAMATAIDAAPVPTYTIGTFGSRGHLHPHAYYFLFYQLSPTQVLMFYVDMSTDFFAPSFRLAGDMNIRGELTVQDGVWIGGKLLRAYGDGLVWGDVVLGTNP
jgi:hypothetical protein